MTLTNEGILLQLWLFFEDIFSVLLFIARECVRIKHANTSHQSHFVNKKNGDFNFSLNRKRHVLLF